MSDTDGQLRYLGEHSDDGEQVAYREMVLAETADDMSTQDIDNRIGHRLQTYATVAYVDAQDAKNADRAYVNAGDAELLKLDDKNLPGGVAGLGADTGRIDPNRIDVGSDQQFFTGVAAPDNYGVLVFSDDDPIRIFPVTFADPGFDYHLMVTGTLDGYTDTEEDPPQITVHAGTQDGPVLASGIGGFESYTYLGEDRFERTKPDLGNGWEEYWSGPGDTHAETDGAAALLVLDGHSTSHHRRGIFRRKGTDATTATDYQEIVWTNDGDNSGGSLFGNSARNIVCGRMSQDGRDWAGFIIEWEMAYFAYSVDGEITVGAGVRMEYDDEQLYNDAGTTFTARIGTEYSARRFELLRGDLSIIVHDDTATKTWMGPDWHGWGFGFQAGNNELFAVLPTEQLTPASLRYITVADATPGQDTKSYAPVCLLPEPGGLQQTFTGELELHVMLSHLGSGVVSAGYGHHPSLSLLAVPAQ